MSTVHAQRAPGAPANHTAPSTPSPSQSTLTPERLNALLTSGPDWSRPPKTANPSYQPSTTGTPAANDAFAQQAMAKKNLDHLRARLTKDAVEQLLSNPHSKESGALVDELRPLLTEDTITSMLRGPDADANAKVLQAFGEQLSQEKLASSYGSARGKVGKKFIEQLQAKNLDMLFKAFDGGSYDDIIGHINQTQENISKLKRNFSDMNKAEQPLNNISALLKKEKLDTLRRAAGTDSPASASNPPGHGRTYSFSGSDPSTADAPSEIRQFGAGDKLDLSGIRSHLNKPLHFVESFSGASAQMQLHYQASTNTSVIAIGRGEGQSPYVIKVFGEVRRNNLLT